MVQNNFKEVSREFNGDILIIREEADSDEIGVLKDIRITRQHGLKILSVKISKERYNLAGFLGIHFADNWQV